jgi:hypothetical protein
MGVGSRPGRPSAPHQKKRSAKSRGEMARPKSSAAFHSCRNNNMMLLCKMAFAQKLRLAHGR